MPKMFLIFMDSYSVLVGYYHGVSYRPNYAHTGTSTLVGIPRLFEIHLFSLLTSFEQSDLE